MQEKDGAEVERHERHVEQRRRPGARQEGADLIEVAQRLQAVAAAPAFERERLLDGENARAQVGIDARGSVAHEARAQRVEQRRSAA